MAEQTYNPDAAFERVPPQAHDAEMCTLASLMLAGDDAEMFAAITSQVTGESFYLADHKIIFEAIVEAHRRGAVDAILVRDELTRLGKLDEIGGTRYLGDILGKVPSAAHGAEYARVVAEKHVLREIIRAANRAIGDAYAQTADPGELASGMMSEMLTLTTQQRAGRIVTMEQAVQTVRDAMKGSSVLRLPTGILKLDAEIGGFPRGKFTVVGARPGMGKSLFAKQVAFHIARAGVRVGIVTVEEDRKKIANNAAANESGVDNRLIDQNKLSATERIVVEESLDAIAKLPIYIADDVSLLREVEAEATTMAIKHHCELIVVDHMHLIELEDTARANRMQNDTSKTTMISKRLKSLAKRLGVAFVCVAQLNRGNEQRADRPRLRDLRESGSIEQDGDLIILLHREDYYHQTEQDYQDNNELELIIAKNKDGRCGTLIVTVDLKTQSIVNETSGQQTQMFQPDDSEAQRRRVAEVFG